MVAIAEQRRVCNLGSRRQRQDLCRGLWTRKIKTKEKLRSGAEKVGWGARRTDDLHTTRLYVLSTRMGRSKGQFIMQQMWLKNCSAGSCLVVSSIVLG